jgi:hypothetical protein
LPIQVRINVDKKNLNSIDKVIETLLGKIFEGGTELSGGQ